MRITRRQFLAASLLPVFAGSVWLERQPTIPSSMSVESIYRGEDVRTETKQSVGRNPLAHAVPRNERERYDILDSRAETTKTIAADDGLDTFIEETDFASSYLVLVQTGLQPQAELELREIERGTDALAIHVGIDYERSIDDITRPHSILVRITDEEDTPASIELDITGCM